MSIVLVIISTIAVGAIAYLTISLEQRGLLETQHKLSVIKQTLMKYRLAYNRLPCPGVMTSTWDTSNFGREADPGCSGLPTGTVHSDVVIGMLPTQALGLPDDYAFDGWGRRFQYVMLKTFAPANAFLDSDKTVNSAVNGMMEVYDTANPGQFKSNRVIYGVISFGANGHGGYTRAGTRLFTGSTNTYEQANCGCDSAAVNTGFAEKIYQGVPTGDPSSSNQIDDIVMYETRASMRSLTE
jgi:type II secretory pathway pseudopilin PulG